MTMPIDLVLVRHGYSEGNSANQRSRSGDDRAFTSEFLNRHSSQWRLTDRGRQQAEQAGIWIRENLAQLLPFDHCYTSEYVRAMETAALLGLPLPPKGWFTALNLRERDWGEQDVMTMTERMERYGENYAKRDVDRLYWKPVNGESIAEVCLRLYRVLDTLHRDCSDGRVLIVCHGDIIRSFRLMLERMSQDEFHSMSTSTNPHDRTHNCSIFHYTRRDPNTGHLDPYYKWLRHVCPWDQTLSPNIWQPIDRKTYSNAELLARAEAVTRLVNTS